MQSNVESHQSQRFANVHAHLKDSKTCEAVCRRGGAGGYEQRSLFLPFGMLSNTYRKGRGVGGRLRW